MSFEAANTSANQPTITAAVIAVPGPVLFDVNDFQRGTEDIGEYLQPDREFVTPPAIRIVRLSFGLILRKRSVW